MDVVFGGDEADSDSESEGELAAEMSRTHSVLVLRDKKLDRQEDGVQGYEKMLIKKIKDF